jgi:serine phosphatase RsbU (regulator of sigma subunit)
MKKIFALISLLILYLPLKAQDGARLLTNYKESTEIENQNWAICQDDNNVMLFANRRGILSYDGQSWNYISMPTMPYSLKYDPDKKRVFVGGDNNYGYMARDEKGIYKYFSISGDSSSVGLISKIIYTDTTVYFYGDQCISRHNIRTGNLERRFRPKDRESFTGMFITPKSTYINVITHGLFKLEHDSLFPVITDSLSLYDEILFSLPYDSLNVLLGRNNGELSLFDGSQYTGYQIQDEGYLRQNILSEGLSISDSLYAFSTLEGGVLVVEKRSGKIKYTINYINGLPDDEIFALGADNNHGLWLSHQYGLTRADMQLPIDNFSIYPGLKGNLITSLWHNNELYIATSEGVFYLKEIKNYAEVEILVKQEKLAGPPAVESPGKEEARTRKGFLALILGKKSSSKTTVDVVEQPVIISPKIRMPEPKRFKKVAGRLKSINYVYRKIEGLNEKCKQLVSAGDEILASTNKGLFVISGHKAKPVVNYGYINNISAKSKDNKYFIATSEGYFYIMAIDNRWSVVHPDKLLNRPIYSIISEDGKTVWAGGDDIAYRFFLNDSVAERTEQFSVKSDLPERYVLESVNDTIFLFTVSKVSYFNKSLNGFVDYERPLLSKNNKLKFIFSQPGIPWIKTGDEWINIRASSRSDYNDKSLLKIIDNPGSICTDKDNIWVVSADNMIFRIVRNKMPSINPEVGLIIKSVSDAKGLAFELSDIKFGSGDNTVYFDLVAPGYVKKNSTQYQYIVDKVMTEWSKWSYNTTIPLMIKPGKYTLVVRAKDLWGNVSQPKVITFSIDEPFTQSTFFYIIVLCLVVVIIIGVIRFRERQLQKDKRILEKKVKERTAQIEAQNHEIKSSIEYASRIQMAMLPEDSHFKNSFSDYFIIFNPRDIVSGDFYWIGEDEKRIFFTVADCTGHGVPGAFMSTLGISILDEIITNNKNLKANTILNMLSDKIKTSLHQTGKEGEAADGMDLAMCILHKNRNLVEYSGAYNPLLIFSNGEHTEYRADRMPIGIYYGKKDSFTNYEINVKEGDTLYIFSDGYADQFGGKKGNKYMKYNLKKLLAEIHAKPMSEQRKILENEFHSWKGTTNQIDDVTILGVRI